MGGPGPADPMPVRESEAFILRTHPFQEADLIVSFFSRDQGKLRGIAKGVRRLKSRFGSGLERLSHARVHYYQKHTAELVRIDRSELLSPPLITLADYPTHLALDYVAEIADEMNPDHEPHDAYFRLLLAVLGDIWRATAARWRNGGATAAIWRPLTYYALWSVRFGGWLPPLNVCLETGAAFGPEETVWFSRVHDGLMSADVRTRGSWALAPESRALARDMLRKPLSEFDERSWKPETAADLRLFLHQRLEVHLERRLRTLPLLEAL